jgi:hypothetical protein
MNRIYGAVISADLKLSIATLSQETVDELFSALQRVARESNRAEVVQLLERMRPRRASERFQLCLFSNNDYALFEIVERTML